VTRPLKLTAQALALAGVAGLLALLVWKLGHQEHAPRVGAVAPAFTLHRLDGHGNVSLAAYRGKAVVLNFWASWCRPCNIEAPALQRAWRQHDGRVVVLGIDINDFSGSARKFMRKHRVTYPVVHDNQDVTSPTYGLTGLPETFFVNRRGLVVAHVTGQVSASELRDGIQKALRA
jgi:peroxiredoxin